MRVIGRIRKENNVNALHRQNNAKIIKNSQWIHSTGKPYVKQWWGSHPLKNRQCIYQWLSLSNISSFTSITHNFSKTNQYQ